MWLTLTFTVPLRVFQLLRRGKAGAKVPMRPRILGVEPHGVSQRRDRFVGAPLPLERHA